MPRASPRAPFVHAQTNKPGVPQVAIWRPFGELELAHEQRFQPSAILHFLGGVNPCYAITETSSTPVILGVGLGSKSPLPLRLPGRFQIACTSTAPSRIGM
jgi:hypothetical protein